MTAPTRWYASRAAAERDDIPFGSAPAEWDNTDLCLYDVRTGSLVRIVDVTGRSMRHVDRLARDWIGHGVSPAWDGSRGVACPECPGHVNPTDAELRACPVTAWLRAEERAARVVSR